LSHVLAEISVFNCLKKITNFGLNFQKLIRFKLALCDKLTETNSVQPLHIMTISPTTSIRLLDSSRSASTMDTFTAHMSCCLAHVLHAVKQVAGSQMVTNRQKHNNETGRRITTFTSR